VTLVLGVDPGRAKAGYAVVTAQGTALAQGVAPLASLAGRLEAVLARNAVTAIALGRGTNGRQVRALLERFALPIHWVDEFETSRTARTLYFADHPPRGWKRLLPIGLQLPERSVDDYAAIAIARRFLARGAPGASPS
jgi:RNase H-fold protein (predicted Holliday junction resolvase)